MQWRSIDLAAGSLEVTRSLEQTRPKTKKATDGLRFKSPKSTRSRRTIALPASAVEILQRHRADQAKERLALGLGRNESDLVFTQLEGEPVIPNKLLEGVHPARPPRWPA